MPIDKRRKLTSRPWMPCKRNCRKGYVFISREGWWTLSVSTAEVLQQEPASVDAPHLPGIAAIQSRRTNRGSDLLVKAIGLNPNFAPPYNDLGKVLSALGRLTIAAIIPTARREAFDGFEWASELRYDGFRAIADTVNVRMLSKHGNRMHRFEALFGTASWVHARRRGARRIGPANVR
jgi:hypothetical protein